MNLEKLVSQIHSDSDSAESIADSDFEDGELREMLASTLFVRGREEDSDSSRKPKASGKPDAMVKEEQVHNELKLITQDERA